MSLVRTIANSNCTDDKLTWNTLPTSCVESLYQCDHFTSQLLEIDVNFNRTPLTIYKRPLATPWERFMVADHFCSVPVKIFLGSAADLPICPHSSMLHLCWPHSAVPSRCIQITISNRISNHFNQYPACNYWKYRTVLGPWAFSDGDDGNYLSVTWRYLKKSYTLFVRLTVLPRGYAGIDWRRSHKKKTVPFSVSWGRAGFSQYQGPRWGWSHEL